MIDQKKAAEIEQAQAAMAELFPPVWRQLYLRCVAEGFTEPEAIGLVHVFILSNNPYGIRP